jgi:hypothetical protein
VTGNRWLISALLGSLVLVGCAEQEADDLDAGMEPDPAMEAERSVAAESAVDTASTDLATWNTDADARLGPDEFDGWLQEQDFYAQWNTDGTEGLSVEEFGAGLLGVLDANDDGAIGQTEWEDAGSAWGGEGAAFADLDADGGGSLDDPELVVAIQNGPHWSAWDADGDGALSEDEFHGAVFGAWDANDDDFVDESEWQANFDLW